VRKPFRVLAPSRQNNSRPCKTPGTPPPPEKRFLANGIVTRPYDGAVDCSPRLSAGTVWCEIGDVMGPQENSLSAKTESMVALAALGTQEKKDAGSSGGVHLQVTSHSTAVRTLTFSLPRPGAGRAHCSLGPAATSEDQRPESGTCAKGTARNSGTAAIRNSALGSYD